MFGIYLTGEVPFRDVYLHGIVRALDGRKMSKSLGNVINPEEYIEEFGVDALRMGLVSGTANGKDFNFPRDKVIGYKKFANKIWNIGRFVEAGSAKGEVLSAKNKNTDDEWILEELNKLIKQVDRDLGNFRFADAGEAIYQFVWHEFADIYIEKVKNRKEEASPTLWKVLTTSLKLLHPFMPFVTEAIWQELRKSSFAEASEDAVLITSKWPVTK